MLYLQECWREGFKAGELFIKQCPYTGNSLEARNWRNGWLEGAAKTVGLDYCSTPAEFPAQSVNHGAFGATPF